ncbi:Pecanex-like protein 4 [Amphibalanus amphitrite]|uniref:Pecanex-like protein n=1 Tax=Amphibalanus amphitrite TaxID=1232801 RepID=A0A6A4WRV5_AMPAM|nr:Pecanex-like protein 4 [Amphibalanus amphitrite]
MFRRLLVETIHKSFIITGHILQEHLQIVGVLAERRSAAQRDVKTNILAQDDEVVFEGVCHSATWAFIIPAKRRMVSLALHPLAAGLAAAAAAVALSPDTLPAVSRHGAALVVLFPVLGWLSVCTGLYSVTVARPPEPATLRALDDWEVAALNRPLHLLLLSVPLLLIQHGWPSPTPDWLITCDVVARLTMCALPLLWLFGVIPPMDVAFGWLSEQTLILLCGGSPCVTPSRLALQLLLASALAVPLCCLPAADRLLPAAVGGCLLSADVAGLLQWLWRAVVGLCRRRPPSLPGGWWRSLLYPAVCGAAGGAVTAAGSLRRPPPGALPSLGAALLALAAGRAVFVELQRERLLLLTLFITWEIEAAAYRPPRGSPEDLLSAVCLARCYRWVGGDFEWSGCGRTRRPLCRRPALVFLVRLLWPTAADWRPEFVLTAASALRDRLTQLRGKLYMTAVLLSSWLSVKERKRAHVLFGEMMGREAVSALNTALLPITAGLLALSCLFSAPLLPVCTLPLFVATFPRRPAGRVPAAPQTAGPDAVYYQQMSAPIADVLGRAVWDGCAGFVQPGDYLLLRFEDRLMWVYIAEMGNAYIYFCIKGLELQETSCHAAEATRVDAIFDCAFDVERSAESAGPLAPFWFHALTPLTQLHVPGYSDARSQLTGVIDNSATLAAVEELFPKVLAWTLVQHLLTTDAVAEEQKLLAKAVQSSDTAGGKSAARADSMERYKTALSSPAPPALLGEVAEWSDGSQGSLLLFEPQKPAGVALGAAPWLRQVLDADDGSPGSDGEGTAPPPPPLVSSTTIMFPRQFWVHTVTSLLEKEAQKAAKGQSLTETVVGAAATDPVESLGGDAAVERVMENHRVVCQLVDSAYHGTARQLQVGSSPARVLSLYKEGGAPDTPAGTWLRGAPVVAALARRAYRWSVKLALDSILLGGFDSDDELLDTLEEYSTDWYIGLDSDPGWREAVLQHKPSLFSLGYDDSRNTYTSHLLSLGDQTVSVGSLSAELVRGVWASLALELLYVTNDDEERYSIQAHPMILRNLTVQAADPPLGYPVFSGPPVRSSHV